MWPPLPVGRITSAAPEIKLSPVNEAVEIVDIRVGGHSITTGEAFVADDDWLRTLTVRLRNVSGQSIVGARVGFGLPETEQEGRRVSFSMDYGKRLAGGGSPPDGQAVVKPDEEFELKFSEAQYQNYLQFFAKQAGSINFSQVWLGITTIRFEDGTIWGSGCLRAVSPRNLCKTYAE